jgi:hypothetical protein
MNQSPLVYSEDAPTKPGWYWRRDRLGETIEHIRLPSVYPNVSWQARKAAVLAAMDPDARAFLESKTNDSHWRIEWAGPIGRPSDRLG